MTRTQLGKIHYYPYNAGGVNPEQGHSIAAAVDEQYFRDHPNLTQFVRPRIPGEFAAWREIQDPALRSQMLTALTESDATLVTRTGNLIERELAITAPQVEIVAV